LKSAEFFDVTKHKQITFSDGSIEKSKKDSSLELWGNLTIKGISKRIKLSALFGGLIRDPYGNEKVGFTITGKINRKDWGLTWNTALEGGGVVLGDDVTINCEIELIKSNADDLKIKIEELNDKKVAAL
jgi:polyisoprenoid-binding protein YceI